MKKLFSLVLGVSFFLPVFALAATDCDITPASCQGNGNPVLVTQVWGLIGAETPSVTSGTVVMDGFGTSFTCPLWFPYGCYDITKTAFYLHSIGK